MARRKLEKSEAMCQYFDKSGSPYFVVQAGHRRAQQIHWQRALQTAQKENTDRILFTITFYPTTTQLNLSFQKNFKLLQNDSDWFYLFAASTYFIQTRQTRKQLFGQNFISNQWPTWT